MTQTPSLHQQLVAALAASDFADRYYRYYEQRHGRGPMSGPDAERVAALLARTGRSFRYDRREQVYAYRERHARGRIGLNVALPYSTVELILVLECDGQQIGGPFPALARKAALLRDPAFSYEPRAPKLPFGTEIELAHTLMFGVELFDQARAAAQSSGLLGS